MQFHRLASFILGLWLGASILMDVAASQNFQSVTRVLSGGDLRMFELTRAAGGSEPARLLLRQFAGETNRFLFENWEWAELLVGLALFLVLLFARSYQKLALALCLGMFVIVASQRFYLTPAITELGRAVEGGQGAMFKTFHALYGGAEIAKLLLGFGIALCLLIRPSGDKKTFVRQFARETVGRDSLTLEN